ncbi:Flagellar transcriptional regulator FlhD [Achromobacter pestifer]|uniref:Flagellar transcriptional regulator FlhD n=2 Tax=Achromobacter pestifer TaxID=1353889 RepID=A0A6S6YJ19_9BURK|nr:flagellar transcriptional regulator FlhD [Achromobacter pestifer]CAB3627099.1 Flagellar transcriptional regulator FlhD [Achromobacter pestifer]
MPRSTELLRDIHETNLMYLLLLQRMARTGNAAAMAGLQISQPACQWLAALQHDDLVKMSRCSVLLAQLDLAPHMLLSALSQGIDATLASRLSTGAPPERKMVEQP